MREIKFRGKDIVTSKWLYGDLRHRIACCPSIIHDYNNNGKIDYAETPVHRDSVGQFTGLHDKNGEEIYEWDIVERFQPMPHYRNGVFYDGNAIYGVVRYIDAGFYILCDNQAYELSRNFDMWVQGNIHDNPKLLNK